jgi:hypothetical protein
MPKKNICVHYLRGDTFLARVDEVGIRSGLLKPVEVMRFDGVAKNNILGFGFSSSYHRIWKLERNLGCRDVVLETRIENTRVGKVGRRFL